MKINLFGWHISIGKHDPLLGLGVYAIAHMADQWIDSLVAHNPGSKLRSVLKDEIVNGHSTIMQILRKFGVTAIAATQIDAIFDRNTDKTIANGLKRWVHGRLGLPA